jgi:uncharacterized protein YwgA
VNAKTDVVILLRAMEALKNAGSWCGETHVQKAVFLCQEIAEVPSKFKFILYKHGPYSFELSEVLQGLIADELVAVQPRPPYGPGLALAKEAQQTAKVIDRDSATAAKIDFICQKVNRKGVGDLEKLATAVFVNRKNGRELPIEKRAELLTSLKPHVPLDAAREAFIEAEAIEREARQAAV